MTARVTKKKPARKTVTAWAFGATNVSTEPVTVYHYEDYPTARAIRGNVRRNGYPVGPLTRIEVPLPEGK